MLKPKSVASKVARKKLYNKYHKNRLEKDAEQQQDAASRQPQQNGTQQKCVKHRGLGATAKAKRMRQYHLSRCLSNNANHSRMKCTTDSEFRERQRQRMREKYACKAEYRNRLKAQMRQRYIVAQQKEKNRLVKPSSRGRPQCVKCWKVYKSSRGLMRHMQTHVGRRQPREHWSYKCVHCRRSFKLSASFERHMLRHTDGTFHHVCDQCQRSSGFSSCDFVKSDVVLDSSVLQQQTKCDRCQRMFMSVDELEHHQKLVHRTECCSHCEPCQLCFTQRSHVQQQNWMFSAVDTEQDCTQGQQRTEDAVDVSSMRSEEINRFHLPTYVDAFCTDQRDESQEMFSRLTGEHDIKTETCDDVITTSVSSGTALQIVACVKNVNGATAHGRLALFMCQLCDGRFEYLSQLTAHSLAAHSRRPHLSTSTMCRPSYKTQSTDCGMTMSQQPQSTMLMSSHIHHCYPVVSGEDDNQHTTEFLNECHLEDTKVAVKPQYDVDVTNTEVDCLACEPDRKSVV